MSGVGGDVLSLALFAAAHPVRRELMSRLAERPKRITELASAFPISLPAVSRHLKVLEAAGLVTRRIEGRDHFIEARSDGLQPVAGWVARQSAEWQARLDLLKVIMEAARD
jgi:DNA-binding transcriptional ArsR family regulator